ncbi:MAG: hypothetical protein QOF53_1089 [Nocardioidaceae bacterium]|nr:hypothetical protein [Nocardioidaceae bacterium]
MRALALTPAVLVLSASAGAVADPPDTWRDNPHVSATHTLLVLGAIPLALFLLITLLVYLPSMRHRGDQGQAWRGEPEWFGGPREGLEAVDKSERPAAVESGAGPAGGGTSGRW